MHDSVPDGLVVALYKGTQPGLWGIYNRLGRYLDGGKYSHAELCIGGLSYSSSLEDGGVRVKTIGYSSVGSWDFVAIPDPKNVLAAGALKWFNEHMNQPYDILGNIHFALGFVKSSSDKWFCSESVAASLGFHEAYRYGPSGLAVALQDKFGAQVVEI